MASFSFPDVWAWIQNLPPITEWRKDSMSVCICCLSSSQPSLKLSISKNPQSSFFSLSILADFSLPISLWNSKPFKLNSVCAKLIDEETISYLFTNFVKDVLNYCPNRSTSTLKIPKIDSLNNFKDIFNISFLTLTFLICIYEAPADLRSQCLNTLKNQLACPRSRESTKLLARLVGSNLEEQWMRSVNLAITNWIMELQANNNTLKTPSSLFSYAISTVGLWKVQLYCPVIAMDVEKSTNPSPPDERLWFSLKHRQLEGVIQLNYRLMVREKWVDVIVNVDNIRCDVMRIVTETLMTERGAGTSEKHFPSRVSLQLTPTLQTNVLSVSVGKSSENPIREIGSEKTLEGSFDPPNSLGLKVSVGETMTMSLKPWKFEQSVYGNSAILNWFLHDTGDGREVFSSQPSKMAFIQPKAWFKNRYSSAYRPFTRQGGVIFAHDEYGDNVWWKVDKGAMGRTMEWEIKGWIWLTYWPNKHRTFYSETRRLEFRETLPLTLA
ncbi:Acetyl-coenzyme A synthetase [Actinidia chinensis var. chinensis]|uniref:Acetyl-coenzyme A synthetase n=1 Tax=Actinidia chinensis var. chinensis TaxID=1590841 RepID=A0A2R6PLN5_ACTCC|nr:Acetyl-coenzyme A synthetase [Actinidia chinensis var. chinensis]